MHLRRKPEPHPPDGARNATIQDTKLSKKQLQKEATRDVDSNKLVANDAGLALNMDHKAEQEEQGPSSAPDYSQLPEDMRTKETTVKDSSSSVYHNADAIEMLNKAKDRILHLQAANEELESSIRRIQTQAFRRFNSSSWTPDCNEDISRKLDRLESAVRLWAKGNSIRDMHDIQTSTRVSSELLEALKPFSRVENGLIPLQIPDTRAYILVEACIMHHLYKDVFEKPFFVMDDRVSLEDEEIEDAGKKAPGFRRTQLDLHSIYEEILEYDERAGVAWRMQTLRQLSPPADRPGDMQKKRIATCKRTNDARIKAAERLARRLLDSGIACLLLDPTVEERQSSLAKLILQAVEMSQSLWTQMAQITPKYIDDPEIGALLQLESPHVEPHRLLNRYLDRLEGSPILLLSHPALVQSGNEDGTDFTLESLLKKGICWTALPGP